MATNSITIKHTTYMLLNILCRLSVFSMFQDAYPNLDRGNLSSWECNRNLFLINWQTGENLNNCLTKMGKLENIGNKATKFIGSHFTVVKVSSCQIHTNQLWQCKLSNFIHLINWLVFACLFPRTEHRRLILQRDAMQCVRFDAHYSNG